MVSPASANDFPGDLSSRSELPRLDQRKAHATLRETLNWEKPDLIYFPSSSHSFDNPFSSSSAHPGTTNMGRYKFTEEQLTSITDHYTELGRKLAQEESEEILSRYRSRLAAVRKRHDEEVILKVRYRQEIILLRTQLLDVNDQLLALQVAYDELSVAHAKATSSQNSLQGQGFSQEVYREEEYESSEPATTSSDQGEYSDSDDDFDVYQQVRVINESDESIDKRTHFLYEEDGESPFLPPGAPIFLGGVSFAVDPDDNSDSDIQSGPKDFDVSQIQSLISKAHGGDVSARRRIQSLVRDAEKTPKVLRSSAHLYLLKTWRRQPPVKRPPLLTSSSSSSSSHPLYTSNASFPISSPPIIGPWSKTQCLQPEIFVDASEYGLGFVLNGRWLAWKFVRGHQSLPLGSSGKLVMSWAEIVAVEMGVHALIAAGYQNTTIVVRSDNEGVVQALTKWSWTTNHGLFVVLERIYKLCKRSKLKLQAEWVSTKVNPADGPSRGVYSSRTQLFPFTPLIPEHFLGMIAKVE